MKKNKLVLTSIAGAVLSTMCASAGMAAPLVNEKAKAGTVAGAASDTGAARFIVKYRAGVAELSNSVLANQGISQAVSRAGLHRAVPATSRSAAQPAVTAVLSRRMAIPRWGVIKASRNLNAEQAAAFLRELKANPAVERAEMDSWMVPMVSGRAAALVPNDPDYAKYQWNLLSTGSGVHAPEAWTRSQGEGVVVAVIDTGIAQGNPDLQANVLPGYDMISDRLVSRRDSDGRAAGGWDPGNWVEQDYCVPLGMRPHPAEDSGWHGTHVAGTIAQQTNNGQGLAGLAYKAKVVPVRVLGSCGGLGSDIADGIVWAVGGQVPGLPLNENPAEVINMSLGSAVPAACPAFYQEAVDYAVSKGAIIVAAAGNDSADADAYTMGSCQNVILVAATRDTGEPAGFSNRGSRVTLSAPGGNDYGRGSQSTNKNGYIWQMINGGKSRPEGNNWLAEGIAGTSMAAPHVAAAAAMVQSVASNPLTLAQMSNLLKRTATPITFSGIGKPGDPGPPGGPGIPGPPGTGGGSGMGAGILNIDAALVELANPTCDLALASCEKPCNPDTEKCDPVLLPIALVNKVELHAQSGRDVAQVLYSFEAQAGKVLSFMTYGGSGDPSMYVSYGKEPTIASADAKSIRSGSTIETVRFTAPKAGTYYIKLLAPANFSFNGVTLVARQ
ncbi:S8 family serine peptidase [uncultured Stenotrophomonas sp.]|uniref:S8 family serine peptidase n=1 Tax=uncultured Stenotrophomonas sp. TaxID=165438 RepID=UPI0025D7B666|nr:S8 family serine peptidase [uncultured Stenotrophomonas sp.]